jgi:hypothetical protein
MKRVMKATVVTSIGMICAVVIFPVLLDSCKPPPVVDVPASDLKVKIVVTDFEPNPSDGKVIVAVQFFQNGKYVKLKSDVEVKCNGAILSYETLGGLAYADRVQLMPAGGSYLKEHIRQGVTTTVSLPVPPRPEILSPAPNETLARTADVEILYAAGSGDHVTGRAHGTKAGSGSVSTTAGDQPDNGTYSGLDATGFDPGPGSLSLARLLTNTYTGGNNFSSVESEYNSGSKVNITWN